MIVTPNQISVEIYGVKRRACDVVSISGHVMYEGNTSWDKVPLHKNGKETSPVTADYSHVVTHPTGRHHFGKLAWTVDPNKKPIKVWTVVVHACTDMFGTRVKDTSVGPFNVQK